MALTPEQIQAINARVGVSPRPPANTINRRAELESAWGIGANKVEESSLYGKTSEKLGDFSEGVVQGVLDTAKGAGTLVQKGLDKTINRILPEQDKIGSDLYRPETELGKKADEVLEPKSTAMRIGKGAEKIAEFAIPGTAVTKVGKVAEGANLLQKGIGLGKRVLAEAGVGSGVTAVQEGEIGNDAIENAIISSIFPVAGKGATVIKELLVNPENGARVINSLIKPLLKDFSYGKNPGRAVAEEGIVATNLEDLAKQISIRRNEIGQDINKVLSARNDVVLDLTDSLRPLDQAIEQAQKNPRTNAELISRLKNVKDDILKVTTNEAGESVSARVLNGISPTEATQFKIDIGNITKFTGNASDDALVNKALKQVYGNIKEKVNASVPEVAALNEKYADLTSAEIAAKYRDKIAERQNLIKFEEKTVGGGAALATAIATGGAAVPALIVGLGAAGLTKALKTPLFKTNLAKWLAETSAKDKKALFEKAPWVKGVILNGLIDESPEDDKETE